MKLLRYLLFGLIFIGCAQDTKDTKTAAKEKDYSVTSRAASEIRSLNPITGRGDGKSFLLYHVFQSLISVDMKTLRLVPVLAMDLPVIEEIEQGLLHIHYEIRPEAKWDNQTQITGHDVAFTLKVIKNPIVDAKNQIAYYEFIQDIIIDEDNPRKFTLVCRDDYMLTDMASGSYPILPEYFYDEPGFMREITVKMLNEMPDSMAKHPKVRDHAKIFIHPDFSMEIVSGSGPYQLERWERQERMLLRKKDNWWGDGLSSLNNWFEAYPDQIIREVIREDATALHALRAGNLDVMSAIPMKEFAEELPESDAFKNTYNTFTPAKISYEIIGFNMREPLFSDLYTRLALARLVDVEKIISTIYYGMAERTVSYIHPAQKDLYNDGLSHYLFNISQAGAILDTAGWEDTNGDGTIDKIIDGKRVEFEFDLLYNAENERREKVALMFQESARQVGIKINLRSLEYGSYVAALRGFDFDAVMRGVGSNPVETDPKQSWHTASAGKGGSNFLGWGNENTDALIDKLRNTKDRQKRIELHKALQNVIHNQVPAIFLNTYKETIAIKKKFTNTYGTAVRPGFWDSGFMLEETVTP